LPDVANGVVVAAVGADVAAVHVAVAAAAAASTLLLPATGTEADSIVAAGEAHREKVYKKVV